MNKALSYLKYKLEPEMPAKYLLPSVLATAVLLPVLLLSTIYGTGCLSFLLALSSFIGLTLSIAIFIWDLLEIYNPSGFSDPIGKNLFDLWEEYTEWEE